MSKDELSPVDFLYLQESIYDMKRALKPYPRHDVTFPLFRGEIVREDEKVELGDVLTASLKAVDKATRSLRRQGIALGDDPVEINLTGNLVGVSDRCDRIIIKVKPGT